MCRNNTQGQLLCALLFVCTLFLPIAVPNPGHASTLQMETPLANVQSSRMQESRYLREARRYRAEGRYELARQSYALALSVCSSTRRLDIIRQELDGLELILRTLR